MDLLDTDSKL